MGLNIFPLDHGFSVTGNWFKGTYTDSRTYAMNDVVTYLDAAYICIQACTGIDPTNGLYWLAFGSGGTTGGGGGTGNGDMLKSTYDIDGNGIVDRSEKADKLNIARTIAITGAVSGSATFDGSQNITITTTGGTGSGDMTKSIYDTNGDGVVDKAAKLNTARVITLTGAVTGQVSFDGSANVSIDTTGNISSLSDVDSSARGDGKVLSWNGSIGKHTYITNGTGSTLAQLFVNVKDFGAVGNGSTDDSVAIQNAINAAIASGGKLFFPSGTYKHNTTINITGDLHIEGTTEKGISNKGAYIQYAGTGTAWKIGKFDGLGGEIFGLKISRLRIGAATTAAVGFELDMLSECEFVSLHFNSGFSTAIKMRGVDITNFRDCDVSSNGIGMLISDTGSSSGGNTTKPNNAIDIANFNFWDNTVAHIKINNGNGIWIHNNWFEQSPVSVLLTNDSNQSNLDVSDIVIRDNMSTPAASTNSRFVKIQNITNANLVAVQGLLIEGNQAKQGSGTTSAYSIEVNIAANTNSNSFVYGKIRNNQLWSVQTSGIYSDSSKAYLQVENNDAQSGYNNGVSKPQTTGNGNYFGFNFTAGNDYTEILGRSVVLPQTQSNTVVKGMVRYSPSAGTMKLINESSSEVNLGTQVPVPSTLTSTGFVGQWAVDSSFLYVCTATNTWKKTAISTSGSGSSSAINWVSVKDFGATGDGVTDDTTAINAAIASIPASGGTVYVPEGTYMITAGNPYSGSSTDGSIRLKSNVHFKMAKNAIIKVITNSLQNYAVFNLKAASTFIDNVTIEGGMLIGDRTTHTGDVTETSQQGMGIWLEGASNVRIINVTTQNMWGDGIYTKFHSTLGNNKNVLISGFKSYNDRRQGISLCAIDGVTITNSIIENTNGISGASSGIDIEPELGGTVTNVTITGNIFRNCRNGMSVQGATWGVISGNVFTGNTQYGLRLAEPAQYFSVTGNVAKGNALDGFYLNYAVDNIISDNVSQGNGANGINLSNHCDRTTVSNNRCIGNTIAGISSTNGNNLIISGNHCNSNGDSGFDIETGKYNQIDNNQAFGNTKHGIIIYLSSFNKVEGNISSQNGQHGIRIVSCTDTHISNNEATENSQSTTLSYDNICLEGTTTNCFVIGNMARKGALAKLPRNGLRIDSSTVTGTTVSENDLRGGGQTLDYNDLGTGTIIPTKTGTATPTVNANYVGQQFIDTTNKKIYISTGAGAGSADWVDTTATGGIQVVSSLPTATSTLRGTTAILQGGTGVPDTMYVCMKLGDDTYDWFAVR